LGLAYDFRKAFEGQRYIRKPKSGDGFESGVVGVEILWPTLLIQCRMLREALGFIDSTKWHIGARVLARGGHRGRLET
jgi:hypothetical protein